MSSTTELTAPTETLTERRSRWSALLRRGHLQAVIEEVLEQEQDKYTNSKVIDFQDKVTLLRECSSILASAPLVFEAAVNGNLVSAFQEGDELQRDYETICNRAQVQPSIYIHLLADKDGISPTANQYLYIRDIILDYIADVKVSEHAYAIDNLHRPLIPQDLSNSGLRKYLRTETKQRSPHRVKAFQRLCNGIEQRWQETPSSSLDEPLRFPPGECGYAKDAHQRMEQHRNHRSSNLIMNLVEDIRTYLYSKKIFTQHFIMHQFIIYLIFRPNQAAIAEIFCSGLLQVWVDNGGGFNAYPAGRSVASEKKVNALQWEEHERWVRQNSSLEENISSQKEKAEKWMKALEWKVEAKAAGEDNEEMVDDTD